MWLVSLFSSVVAFQTVWDLSGNPATITLPITGSFNISVDWGDGKTLNYTSGIVLHTYSGNGSYTVSITGEFSHWSFAGSGDSQKIKTIEAWEGFRVGNSSDFSGCSFLTVTATDQPEFLPGASLENFFKDCSMLNSDLSWDITGVKSLAHFLQGARSFNGQLDFIGTNTVTDMSWMLSNTSFNQNLDHFDTSNVIMMEGMFRGSNFNQRVNFNTSKVVSMFDMFAASPFNQPLNFDTRNVVNMRGIFYFNKDFNQFVNFTDTSKVTDMSWMFANGNFNQNVNHFDTSNVISMEAMFAGSYFNQPLILNTDKVTNMDGMFRGSLYGGPVTFSSTAAVTQMSNMFPGYFLENLAAWDVSAVTGCDSFCAYCGLPNFKSCSPCLDTQSPVATDPGWLMCSCDVLPCGAPAFTTVWDTKRPNQDITLPLDNTFSIIVDWGDGTPLESYVAPPIGHTYAGPAEYTISIVGAVGNWNFRGGGSCTSIVSISSWGNFQVGPWSDGGFEGCSSLTLNASDQPVFLPGANLAHFFKGCSLLNIALGWNITGTTSLRGFLQDAVAFNNELNLVGTEGVMDMSYMLSGAVSFNQHLNFSTISVTDMSFMFFNTLLFNQTLSLATDNVRSMANMFDGSLFVQDVANWSVSAVRNCSSFCSSCNLPAFQLCTPCAASLITSSGWQTCTCASTQFCAPFECPSPAYSGSQGVCACGAGFSGVTVAGRSFNCSGITCSGAYSGSPGNCSCAVGYFGSVTYASNRTQGCVGVACYDPYVGSPGACSCISGYIGKVAYSGNATTGCVPLACPACDVTVNFTRNVTQLVNVGTTQVVISPNLLKAMPNATMRITTVPITTGPPLPLPPGGDVIISIDVYEAGQLVEESLQLQVPIVFTIPFGKKALDALEACDDVVSQCVWRNGSLWAHGGCQARRLDVGIECSCTHLTDFAVLLDQSTSCQESVVVYYPFAGLYSVIILYCSVIMSLLLAKASVKEFSFKHLLKIHGLIALVGLLRLLSCLRFLGVFGDVGPAMNALTTAAPYPLEYLLFSLMVSSWIGVIHFSMSSATTQWTKVRPILIAVNVVGSCCAVALFIGFIFADSKSLIVQVGTAVLSFFYLALGAVFYIYSRALAKELALSGLSVSAASTQKRKCLCGGEMDQKLRWIGRIITWSFIIQSGSNIVALVGPKEQLNYWTALFLSSNISALTCLTVLYYGALSRLLKWDWFGGRSVLNPDASNSSIPLE